MVGSDPTPNGVFSVLRNELPDACRCWLGVPSSHWAYIFGRGYIPRCKQPV